MAKLIVYIRDKYKKKDGTCAVYCSFYLERKKIRIPLKVNVDPSQWDSIKGRMKGNSKEAKDTNLIIQNECSKINEIFVRFRLDGRTLTKDIFEKEYSNASCYSDFWDFFKKELEKRKGTIAENTFRAQFSTLNKLSAVMPFLPFSEVNEDSIRFIKKTLSKKYGNAENTVTKNMITLKTYILLAKRKKLLEQNPFEIEKIKRLKGNQVWLTETELVRLHKAYKENELPENLHKVLQYFLFSCFTGMRLSDVKNFSMEQIKGEFIILNPIKTKRSSNELVTIPITKPIKNIIKHAAKYRLKGLIFDCFADQVTNRMLKKIATLAGINKEISFHSARHTFASIFLEKTDDLATLQRLLGHTDIKQTMIYVHLTEGKKVEQMKRCWNNF